MTFRQTLARGLTVDSSLVARTTGSDCLRSEWKLIFHRSSTQCWGTLLSSCSCSWRMLHDICLPRNIQLRYLREKRRPAWCRSFILSQRTEPGILLSLWASRMIQAGQLSARTRSVSARCPFVRFGGLVDLSAPL